jgi:hypothetical protein
MKKYLFLALSVLFLALGLGAMFIGHGKTSGFQIVEGMGKGLGGVFFILFYILVLLEKQPQDKTTSGH